MAPPQLAFLSGVSLPLTRPRPLAQAPTSRRRRAIAVASAASNASQASDLLSGSAGNSPDVAFGSLSPPLRAVASALAVAASAGLAFVAAPPSRPVLRPAAAVTAAVAVTSVTALASRSGPSKAARKYLANSLRELGVDSPDLPARVAIIPGKFGISADEFVEMRQSLYEYFFLAMLEDGTVTFDEISQLARLKHSLALPGAVVGDAHYESCRAFYRNNIVFLDAEDDQVAKADSQRKLDKLVFLSDRMYADKDTEEAYRYEKFRIIKFFNMTNDDYSERIARVALPFYKEVVVRASVDSTVTKEDVIAAQATLGVQDVQAERIRTDAYANRVDALVSEKGKLDEVDNEALSRLRTLLSIEDDRASTTLKTLAEPVFRTEVGDALDAVAKGEESFASIYGRLALRQTELNYPTDAARATMAKEMTSRAIDIVRTASKYLRVQNVNSCILQLKEMLKYVDGVIELMRVSNDDLSDDVAIIKMFLPGVTDLLSKVEPRQMYRIFLSNCLEDRKISDEDEVQLLRLRAVMGLDEQDALDAFSIAAGPVYRKAVMEALKKGSFEEEDKSKMVAIRDDLSLPEKTWKNIETEIYRERLRNIVDGNRIIQEQEAQDMFVLREFLGLTMEDVAPIHKACMSPVYEQSVTEAMGPTGIMLDEYRNGLERLRERLGLTKEAADDAFHRVVKQRMLMYVNRAMSQLEKRQAFRGQNDERDVGEDPNIKRAGAFLGIDAGGLPIELSNLVDFYVRNGLAKEEEVEVEGEKKTITKYPVTLREDITPKVYNELYKQYVIQCFSASTRSEKQRLFAALDQLGSILGMTEEEIGSIHADIGTVIYKNYVNQALIKGPLEEKDNEFLTNIQNMLAMKEDQCANLLRDSKQNRISVMLEQIFAQPKVLPETVKRMRTMADALEVDLVKDLSVSDDQRSRLFGVEVDAAIDTGMLTAENQNIINEVQKSLHVTDEAAKEVLLKCIQRRTLSHLVQAAASLRQERSETAVAELKTMLRYGKLLPAKVNAPAVSTAEKQELYLLFQADMITDGAVNDADREQVNLLKTLFGFSDADLQVLV